MFFLRFFASILLSFHSVEPFPKTCFDASPVDLCSGGKPREKSRVEKHRTLSMVRRDALYMVGAHICKIELTAELCRLILAVVSVSETIYRSNFFSVMLQRRCFAGGLHLMH